MTVKSTEQINWMVERIEKLVAQLPPYSGHCGILRDYISDLQAFKSGKRPDYKEIAAWLYNNESSINVILHSHEEYLRLINILIEKKTTVSFDRHGRANDAMQIIMEELNIDAPNFSYVGARLYNDQILKPVSPGIFTVIPIDQWSNEAKKEWMVCSKCYQVTYNFPCDFCGE